MSLTFSDYLNLLESGIYRQRIKLQTLHYSDLSIIQEITGDIVGGSGSLNVERKNGCRRTMNCSIVNSTINQVGKYIPDIANGVLPPRQPFRLWLGLADENDEEYYISQGIFFMADPVLSSNLSESIITLDMVDPFGLFDDTIGGSLTSTYIIPVGTNIYTAITSILATENSYPLPCILDAVYVSEVTPYTITKEAGSGTYGDILTDLAYMLSANLFFNSNGNLVFSQDINDAIKGSVYDFTTDNAQYLGATNKYDYTSFYNSVLVVGQNVNGAIYSAEVSNTSLLSETSVNNIGFKRQKRIEDANISSTQLCTDRANFELKRLIAIQNEVSISSIPFFHIGVDDAITLTDANLGYNRERFIVNSLSIPFSIGGQMTINATHAINLPFNDI
jgi:hypothetical protein